MMDNTDQTQAKTMDLTRTTVQVLVVLDSELDLVELDLVEPDLVGLDLVVLLD